MSNKQDMSDELKLPADLAACEARLAAQPLPALSLNRDELMYRAGWAAAEAARVQVVSPPSKGGARGGIRDVAIWSAASAALAASLAVAVTLAAMGGSRTSAEVPAAGSHPPLADASTTRPAERLAHVTPQIVPRGSSALDAALRRNNRTPAASVWAAISDSKRSRWDEPIITPTSMQQPSPSADSTPAPPSWQQLRSLKSGDSI